MLFLRVGLTLPDHFWCVLRRGRATGAVRSIIHPWSWLVGVDSFLQPVVLPFSSTFASHSFSSLSDCSALVCSGVTVREAFAFWIRQWCL